MLPRLPLKVSIDLTYRCDNHCRHCWLRLAENAPEKQDELTTDEWREVVDQARALGTREWAISGGEPMLRLDFAEIFEYVTAKARTYSLNTNGTLITPQIARLLRHKGSKMIAVYGASAAVHDQVTRTPGSFEALMEGFARLKEAGAGFTVQLIPMRANWHQWAAMEELAKSLSKHWRVGAPWLYLSACGDAARNAEIAAQRLDPADAIALDEPDLSGAEPAATLEQAVGARHGAFAAAGDDRLFARCIAGRGRVLGRWPCARRRGRRLGGVHPLVGRQGARRRRVPRGLRRLRAARRLPLVRRVRLSGTRAARGDGG